MCVIETGVAIRHDRPGNADGHVALVCIGNAGLPLAAPRGRARHSRRHLDGTATVAHVADARTADEA